MPSTCSKPARMFLEDDSNFACRSGCLDVRSPGSRPHQEVERRMSSSSPRKFRNGVHATARVRGQLELGRYEYVLPDEGENK
jgi:hypothetical protein